MSLVRRPLSLATRLTLLFAVTAAAVFPAFGWLISQSMERHFEEGDTRELEVIAAAIQTALTERPVVSRFAPLEQRFDDLLVGHHNASLVIVDADGAIRYASDRSLHPRALAEFAGTEDANGKVLRWSSGGHSYRVLAQPVIDAGTATANTVVVAVPIDYHLDFLASFRRTLWLMVASSIVLMSLMGWLAVRQGHAPLREIVGRIRQISGSELGDTVSPESVPGELTELAESFNEMLARMNRSFQQLSHFNADIAHELRTPITNLMTQTQVALTKARTIDEYREVLYSNMEEYERMAQMVGDMLFLAQRDNGTEPVATAELDLAAEISGLFEYYEGWAEERGVSLALEGDAKALGDRRMLQRAFGNLVSNAIRHTDRGGTVRVKLHAGSDGVARIAIANPGPEIPAVHLAKLFDRFYRIDPSRTRRGQGAGLGLAIVKSIIEAHGGRIAVRSEAGLTTFEISLPEHEQPA